MRLVRCWEVAEKIDPFYQAASEALLHWDMDVQSIDLISRSENVVFKISTHNDEAYALRIHRPGYNTLAAMNSEHMWSDALRSDGLNNPAYVLTNSGSGYVAIDVGTSGKRQVGLTEWQPGELLQSIIDMCHGERAINSFRDLGELVARMHNQSAAWLPPENFTRRSWDLNGLLGAEPLWGKFWQAPALSVNEGMLLLGARDALYERISKLPTDATNFGLIHADLHPRNVIVCDADLIAIDFDDCGFGWHYYDVAVALGESRRHRDADKLQGAFLLGYRSVRALPEAEYWLPIFTMVRSLISLAWISVRPELATTEIIRSQITILVSDVENFPI